MLPLNQISYLSQIITWAGKTPSDSWSLASKANEADRAYIIKMYKLKNKQAIINLISDKPYVQKS